MKNINDFMNYIKIELQENNLYGHHPYKLFYEDKKGCFGLVVIILPNSVKDCYNVFIKYLIEDAKRIYLSVDFPKTADSNMDFVLIHYFEYWQLKTLSIPYDKKTGRRFPSEKEKMYHLILDQQLRSYIGPMTKNKVNLPL